MTCKDLKNLAKLVKRMGKLANDPDARSDDVIDHAQVAAKAFDGLTAGALLVVWTRRDGLMKDSDHYEAFRFEDYKNFAEAAKAADKAYRKALRSGATMTASITLTLDSTDY